MLSVAWSADGARLASASYDHAVRIWNYDGSPAGTFRVETNAVRSLAWHPDGRRLAIAGDDNVVRVVDPMAGREMLACAGHTAAVSGVAWSVDGGRLASSSFDQTIKLWNATSGRLIRSINGNSGDVCGLAWSPDGSRVASCGTDQAVRIWDAGTGELSASLRGHTARVNAVAWNPDGLSLAVAGDDSAISLYDATAGYLAERSPQLLPSPNRRLAVTPRDAADVSLRAQIKARAGDWTRAAEDANRLSDVSRDQNWFSVGDWVAGPFPADTAAHFAPEKQTDPIQPPLADDA